MRARYYLPIAAYLLEGCGKTVDGCPLVCFVFPRHPTKQVTREKNHCSLLAKRKRNMRANPPFSVAAIVIVIGLVSSRTFFLCGTRFDATRLVMDVYNVFFKKVESSLCVTPRGGGSCFSSIASAINQASSNETIYVQAGTYVESTIASIASSIVLAYTTPFFSLLFCYSPRLLMSCVYPNTSGCGSCFSLGQSDQRVGDRTTSVQRCLAGGDRQFDDDGVLPS